MSSKHKQECLPILYKIGLTIITILAIVALVSFIKAVSNAKTHEVKAIGHYADSLQVECIKEEVERLNKKVDSLELVIQKEPKVVYRNIKKSTSQTKNSPVGEK